MCLSRAVGLCVLMCSAGADVQYNFGNIMYVVLYLRDSSQERERLKCRAVLSCLRRVGAESRNGESKKK